MLTAYQATGYLTSQIITSLPQDHPTPPQHHLILRHGFSPQLPSHQFQQFTPRQLRSPQRRTHFGYNPSISIEWVTFVNIGYSSSSSLHFFWDYIPELRAQASRRQNTSAYLVTIFRFFLFRPRSFQICREVFVLRIFRCSDEHWLGKKCGMRVCTKGHYDSIASPRWRCPVSTCEGLSMTPVGFEQQNYAYM